jgi:hypothetical protein
METLMPADTWSTYATDQEKDHEQGSEWEAERESGEACVGSGGLHGVASKHLTFRRETMSRWRLTQPEPQRDARWGRGRDCN